jgi:hypothetical protein
VREVCLVIHHSDQCFKALTGKLALTLILSLSASSFLFDSSLVPD